MFDKEALKRIAKDLGLDAELFAADPALFLSKHEIGKVLKLNPYYGCLELNGEIICKIPGATIGLDPDDLTLPTTIAENNGMNNNPF